MADWVERIADEGVVAGLVDAGVSPLLARLLAIRGVSAGTKDGYFSPNYRDLAKPEELPGVEQAAEIVLAALEAGGRIVVFGDYDCDGVCATAILALALRAIAKGLNGGTGEAAEHAASRVSTFIPHRLVEGYGLTDASVSRMLSEIPDVSLIVTVDNGVNAVSQIADLDARGIRVVVTDHHLPGEELPRAAALVNPKVAAPEHLSDLCGAAVAYFLAQALVEQARRNSGDAGLARGVGGALFTLAGLATVTDIMPLSPQNRILVAESLRHFPKWAPVGLRELHTRAARTGVEDMTSRDFGFVLGPRINAVGRLGSVEEALSLLLCPERERSRMLAIDIDTCNSRRRQIEQKMTDAAQSQVVANAPAQVIAFTQGDDVHPGVSGIVAARILERLETPVPVCVLVDGKGSARAPAGYNVRDALAAASASLLQYGGHAAAAGLGVKPGEIDSFRADFEKACIEQAGSLPAPMRRVKAFDAWVCAKDLTLEFADDISRMEPFGEGNPEPVFALGGVHFASGGVRTIGATGNHLQLAFRERNIPRAVWWGRGDQIERLRADSISAYDLLFTLGISDFGERHVELNVLDLRQSAS